MVTFLVKRLTKWVRIYKSKVFCLFLAVGVVLISCGSFSRLSVSRMLKEEEFWKVLPSSYIGEFVSVSSLQDGWRLVFKKRDMVVRAIKSGGWQVSWVPPLSSGFFPSYAVDFNEVAFVTNGMKVSQTKHSLAFVRDQEVLEIRKKDGFLFLKRNGKTVFSQQEAFRFEGESFSVGFYLSPEKVVMGLAEKPVSLNLRGQSFTFYNSDAYKYQRGTDPLYLSIPFAVLFDREETVGIFLDNPAQSFWDVGKREKRMLRIGAVAGDPVLYLFSSSHVSNVIMQYTALTGRASLPPLWALGYHQSRFSYFPQVRVIEVAEAFRKKNLPADVIYLDIDFMDGKRSFTHDTNRFPDPMGLLKRLHEIDFKVVTIINPGVAVRKGYAPYETGLREDVFVKLSNGMNAQGTVWPGICVFPDYTLPRTRKWWGSLYTYLISMGFDGFWNDMNEPSVFNGPDKTLDPLAIHDDFGRKSKHSRIHNSYGLTMVQATYEGLTNLVPRRRPFILSRAGYAGIQRYAFIWTGDNTASWDHLRLNLSMVLQLGLSGVPFAGADIGGYSYTPSEELFIRWMQLGVFLPFVRNHTEQGTAPQEPWAFGARAEEISRRYLFARYRLLPLWYTLAYEAHQTGLPVVRPLFWEKGPVSDDAFMVGKNLVVFPVLESEQKRLVHDLPEGSFVDWIDHTVFTQRFEGSVNIENIPVCIRKGSVLPLANISERFLKEGKSLATLLQVPDEGIRSTKDIREITLWVFSGENGEGALYWDDGISIDYRGKYFGFMSYTWKEGETGATLVGKFSGSKNLVSFPSLRWFVIEGIEGVDRITLDGNILPFHVVGKRVIVSLLSRDMWRDFIIEISYRGGKR